MKITKQTGLFIVLGVSLAINVYIIGPAAASAYHSPPLPDPPALIFNAPSSVLRPH